MRYSGLSIGDAATLERERLDDDDNLFLYRAKTGVPVFVPFPRCGGGLEERPAWPKAQSTIFLLERKRH